MPDEILALRGVTKRFGGLVAVDSLDLAIPRGIVFGLMGPNGAGKSALMNLVTGYYRADEGSIVFQGEELVGEPPNVILRRGIARTFQNVRLFPGLTVREQVVCGMYARRRFSGWQSVVLDPRERRERRELAARADELLDLVGVRAKDRDAETLSYGEQRRVEIARALASDPQLLLLDEPTAGMNHREASELGDLMLRLRDGGLTVWLIEHNMRLITEYCELAYVMSFGKRIAHGTPAECVEDPAVQEAYFGRRTDAHRLEALRELRRDRRG